MHTQPPGGPSLYPPPPPACGFRLRAPRTDPRDLCVCREAPLGGRDATDGRAQTLPGGQTAARAQTAPQALQVRKGHTARVKFASICVAIYKKTSKLLLVVHLSVVENP